TGVTVLFTATSPYVIKGYNFVSANDQPMRDPALWILEASTDGDNWDPLDNQSNQAFSGRGVKKSYELAQNEQAYQYYRFDITHGGTDEYGADIVQIGELELMVAADKPLVAFKTNKARAEMGEEIYFLDQSLANPTSWQWTFEGGTPATSTEQHPTVTFGTLGAKSVTLVAGNDKGSNTLIQDQVVWIWDSANPWDGFPEPEVSFVKTDPQHPGQLALEQILPDLAEQIKTTSLEIAKILYQDVTEIPLFKTVTFETGHYDFPAAKSGTETDMLLYMDLGHLNNVAANGADALRAEVLGMLWHELTHGYSGAPQTGQYAEGDEYHTYLESVADFIRIKSGYNEHKRSGVKWVNTWNDDAYNQTSFFLEWVDNSYKSIDFIKQFVQQAKTLESWSFDAAFKAILGEDRGIEVLWSE
ncbi:MAG: PKD domain-containing protein, partial [Psychrosphaera sp.]|nr:PKD domain-containing protein [Psychrosphaera sp.]